MPQREGGWVLLRVEGSALTPMGDPELGPFPETIVALVQGSGDEILALFTREACDGRANGKGDLGRL